MEAGATSAAGLRHQAQDHDDQSGDRPCPTLGTGKTTRLHAWSSRLIYPATPALHTRRPLDKQQRRPLTVYLKPLGNLRSTTGLLRPELLQKAWRAVHTASNSNRPLSCQETAAIITANCRYLWCLHRNTATAIWLRLMSILKGGGPTSWSKCELGVVSSSRVTLYATKTQRKLTQP